MFSPIRRLMNRTWIVLLMAAFCCCHESQADEGSETMERIRNGYQRYVELVNGLSVHKSFLVTLDGNEMMAVTVDSITDGQNSLAHRTTLYDHYYSAHADPRVRASATASSAGISRVRGRYRQSLGLLRATPTSTWVLTQDTSELLTKANEYLSLPEEAVGRLQQLEAVRFAPGYFIITIPDMIEGPGFRFGNITEDRSGPERLVTVEFTIEPPLDPKKAARMPVQAGRMVLRPDSYWTLKSGTFQMQSDSAAGRVIQCEVTNTFYEDSEKKSLPKEVKSVATVITKEGKRAEEIRRATFEFTSYEKVPEERLLLTQFGLSEREPVDSQGEPEPEPSRLGERTAKKNLVASSVPPYVWVTAGGVLLLVIGIALRIWLTRSAKLHNAATAPPPSPPG